MESLAADSTKKKAYEELVEQLLLCDPVTERGRDKLLALGLQNVITPEVFFKGNEPLWVCPKDMALFFDSEETLYNSSPDERRKNNIKQRRDDFDLRFSPDTKKLNQGSKKEREFTLLMGVVGSGKSIEINRQIFSKYDKIPYSYIDKTTQIAYGNTMCANVVYIDMERVTTEITKGSGYKCQDTNNVLGLFFTKLLATVVYYIEYLYSCHKEDLQNLKKVLYEKFSRETRGDEVSTINKYKNFFETLDNYANDNVENLDRVFESIKETVKHEIDHSNDPFTGERPAPFVAGIDALLHLLGFIMFGVIPQDNKCIIVDNVEDLVKVNNREAIDISLDDAKQIYDTLLKYSENIKDIYDDAGLHGSFHIVMSLRRTTWDNLQYKFAGNYAPLLKDMFDITGDVSLAELWKNKAYPIWKNYLKEQFDDNASAFIEDVNRLLCSDNNWNNDVEQRFARIMSHGLRRQGHSLSKALYKMFYDVNYGVTRDIDGYINLTKYHEIFDSDNQNINKEARYLCKSATVELYFMDQLTSTGDDTDEKVGGRWRKLNIGKIEGGKNNYRRTYYYDFSCKRKTSGNMFNFTKWSYQFDSDEQHPYTSGLLLRKMLAVLSEAKEAERASRCAAPLYETISVRKLIKSVLDKKEAEVITNDEFEALAELILAGAKPDEEAEFSPLYLLQNGVDFGDTGFYQEFLSEIWQAPASKSLDGDKNPYSRQRCGIRITESGKDFFFNIQPSFEFFSALFCYDFPPLLFIKSEEKIAHVIGCVYKNAYRACCEVNTPERILYRNKIKTLHTQYLGHYRDYIKNMSDIIGLTEQKERLITKINDVIKDYLKWPQ